MYGVRSRDPGKGKLDLPGGFIEVGESAEQTAIRETKEELGMDIELIAMIPKAYPTTYEGRPILNLAFIAIPTSEHIAPGDDMGGGDSVWRGVENLPGAHEAAAEWFADVQKDFVVWWRKNRQS